MEKVGRRAFGWGLAALGLAARSGAAMSTEATESKRRPSITDVDVLRVGHFTFRERPSGCTVIVGDAPFTAGVDVRGGAPGTRETDLLRPESTVEQVDAIVLAGGSAFGLDAAGGVVRWLEEKGRGFETSAGRVPIVCGAILYDLALGDAKIRPDARAGYEAAKTADKAPVVEGNVGAGAGATVGKLLGLERAVRGGLGSWALTLPDGLQIGALVAVNAVGDVHDPLTGRIVAGARAADGRKYADVMSQLRSGTVSHKSPLRENTVLAVVATNAALTKAQCFKVAQMAQDALPRCIQPSHTPWDGDTVFALATGRWPAQGTRPADLTLVGALAADVLASAIVRGVEQASAWGPYPAAHDLR
jgi:L-aminopeptidase/D-esterase-like protein